MHCWIPSEVVAMFKLRWAVLLLLVTSTAFAQETPKGPERWEKNIAAFEAKDKEKMPPEKAVLFVGSSSIVGWNVAKSFPEEQTINRGFGGSQIVDSVYYAPRIVNKYKPRIVVFYAGDNDIAGGKTPEKVAGDFKDFVKAVQKDLPDTKILFLAIKPSPSRWKMYDKQTKANELVAAFCKEGKNLVYVDVVKPMLDKEGQPRKELFKDDNLHMNEEGYKVWIEIVKPLLK